MAPDMWVSTTRRAQVSAQGLIVQAVADGPVEGIGLHREQVRAVRCFGQYRSPLRVPGVGEAHAAEFDPQRQGRRAARVLDLPAVHGSRAQRGGLPVGTQFGDLHGEPSLPVAGAREQRLDRRG